VTIQDNYKSRPLLWEDETPSDSRVRRVQQAVRPHGRALPGMPLEMTDPDGDDSLRSTGNRFGEAPENPWWRPTSTIGRVFLGLAALLVLGGLGTATYLLKTYIERDARFRIAGASNIDATGLTQVTRADMLPVFGEDIGRNVFFVPLAERRHQLEQIPWVQRATVMRVLPDQIRVQLVERQPVAFVRQGSQIGLVDPSGILLTMPAAAMAQQHYSFPVVTGIDPGDPAPSRAARMAVYGRLLAELDSGTQHLSEQISEIDLTDPEDARVLMPEQGADILAHFGEDHFLERYQRYKAHIAEWRQQYPHLAAVDLRYDQQVVLSMTPGAAVATATIGAPAATPNPDAKPETDDSAAKTKPSAASKAPLAAAAPAPKAVKPLTNEEKAARQRAAREKTAKDKKKRAEAQRAALKTSRPKPATRPVNEGQ